MQAQGAKNQIERVCFEGQRLLVRDYLPRYVDIVVVRQVRVPVQKGLGRVYGEKVPDAGCDGVFDGLGGFGVGVLAREGPGDVACVCAEVEDFGVAAFDVLYHTQY